MGGWNPIETVVDFVSDVVETVVDVVEDVIGWLNPIPEVPDYGEIAPEQQARGVLVNKFALALIKDFNE